MLIHPSYEMHLPFLILLTVSTILLIALVYKHLAVTRCASSLAREVANKDRAIGILLAEIALLRVSPSQARRGSDGLVVPPKPSEWTDTMEDIVDRGLALQAIHEEAPYTPYNPADEQPGER